MPQSFTDDMTRSRTWLLWGLSQGSTNKSSGPSSPHSQTNSASPLQQFLLSFQLYLWVHQSSPWTFVTSAKFGSKAITSCHFPEHHYEAPTRSLEKSTQSIQDFKFASFSIKIPSYKILIHFKITKNLPDVNKTLSWASKMKNLCWVHLNWFLCSMRHHLLSQTRTNLKW